ncbi:MAG: tetratricopeptide repeat protein [Fimbriimonadaceae bacterium]|nr:tetratricopeptide repeat protein [Fimbriimonadaceae bacterium]
MSLGHWFAFGQDAEYDAGVRAFERGDLEEAVAQFRSVVSRVTEPALRNRSRSFLAGALGKLGRSALEAGDPTGAIELLGNAVSVRPKFADLHVLLALAHLEVGEVGNAQVEVETALRINPDYAHAALVQGAVWIMQGRTTEGLIEAVEAASKDRRLETAEFHAGVEAADSGDWEAASRRFASVQPVPFSELESAVDLAERAMRDHDFVLAEQASREARALAPDYPDMAVRHARALMELGRLEEAGSALRDAVRTRDSYAEAWALLGVVLRRGDDETGAIEAFRNALERDPSQPIAIFELGRRV